MVPEAADVSLLVGLVFSKYRKIVFTSSTRHWQISELGNRTNHLAESQSVKSRTRRTGQLTEMFNEKFRVQKQCKCNFGRQHYLTTVSML